MAKQPAVRSDGQLVIRTYPDKSKKVTVSVPPPLADKLRLAAVGLGVDQGDLVAAGLELVLKGVSITVRITQPAAEAASGADPVECGADRLRIA